MAGKHITEIAGRHDDVGRGSGLALNFECAIDIISRLQQDANEIDRSYSWSCIDFEIVVDPISIGRENIRDINIPVAVEVYKDRSLSGTTVDINDNQGVGFILYRVDRWIFAIRAGTRNADSGQSFEARVESANSGFLFRLQNRNSRFTKLSQSTGSIPSHYCNATRVILSEWYYHFTCRG